MTLSVRFRSELSFVPGGHRSLCLHAEKCCSIQLRPWAPHKIGYSTRDRKHFVKISGFLGVIKQIVMSIGNSI